MSSRIRRKAPLLEVLIALALIILVIVGMGAFALAGMNTAKTTVGGSSQPVTVKAQGTIDTVGFATSPVGITFKDVNSDASMRGAVFYSPSQSGQRVYEIIVLNGRTYSVTVDWVGAFGWRGSCSSGTIALFTVSNQTVTVNAKC